jgi:hypothetical protein
MPPHFQIIKGLIKGFCPARSIIPDVHYALHKLLDGDYSCGHRKFPLAVHLGFTGESGTGIIDVDDDDILRFEAADIFRGISSTVPMEAVEDKPHLALSYFPYQFLALFNAADNQGIFSRAFL